MAKLDTASTRRGLRILAYGAAGAGLSILLANLATFASLPQLAPWIGNPGTMALLSALIGMADKELRTREARDFAGDEQGQQEADSLEALVHGALERYFQAHPIPSTTTTIVQSPSAAPAFPMPWTPVWGVGSGTTITNGQVATSSNGAIGAAVADDPARTIAAVDGEATTTRGTIGVAGSGAERAAPPVGPVGAPAQAG